MTNDRIGTILIEKKLLTNEQVETVLSAQDDHGDTRSFGEIASEMFSLTELTILEALAEQAARHSQYVSLNEQAINPECLDYIAARDAWDYLVLPLHVDDEGELICATTVETLPTAIAFLQGNIDLPFSLVLANVRLLEQYIAEQYAYEGVDLEPGFDEAVA